MKVVASAFVVVAAGSSLLPSVQAFAQQPAVLVDFSSLSSSTRRTNAIHPAASSVSTRLNSVPNPLDTLTSGLASICRLPYGVSVSDNADSIPSDEKPILKQLFDIENNVECRKVREKLTELDLNVQAVIPASANSRAVTDSEYEYAVPSSANVFAPILVLEDPASGEKDRTLVGSSDILQYLENKYPQKSSTVTLSERDEIKEMILQKAKEALDFVGNYVASFLRIGRGNEAKGPAGDSAPRPTRPLILYNYEGNQFSRLVREVLMELDIVYELRSVGKGSPRRTQMEEETTDGSTQCPYLTDPNTGISMNESADIVQYLYDKYALYTPPAEILQWASDYLLSPLQPLTQKLATLQAGERGDDIGAYERAMDQATKEIMEQDVVKAPVVVYTYDLSPFTLEATTVLDRLGIDYHEIRLGKEWMPGFITDEGAAKRAALLKMTGQSSLPHIFVNQQSIGGLYTGTPGLIPALDQGLFAKLLQEPSSEKEGSKGEEKEVEEVETVAAAATPSTSGMTDSPTMTTGSDDSSPPPPKATTKREEGDFQ